MKDWLEDAKDAALGALGLAGMVAIFGAVAGCGVGCMLFVVRIFERLCSMIMGVW